MTYIQSTHKIPLVSQTFLGLEHKSIKELLCWQYEKYERTNPLLAGNSTPWKTEKKGERCLEEIWGMERSLGKLNKCQYCCETQEGDNVNPKASAIGQLLEICFSHIWCKNNSSYKKSQSSHTLISSRTTLWESKWSCQCLRGQDEEGLCCKLLWPASYIHCGQVWEGAQGTWLALSSSPLLVTLK